MYEKFFGLRDHPFNVTPDPRFLFQTKDTAEALACLTYGIQTRQGFIVLTGEVGTGKTTLLRQLLEGLRKQGIRTAFVFNPRLEPLEFLDFVMADFGIKFEPGSKGHMLIRLNQWLFERHRAGTTAVLVVDEAQNLSIPTLEEIRLLTNLETPTEKLLQVVLAGQPELTDKLKLVQVRQLRQRIRLGHKTRALTLEETGGYIAERLRIAGAREQTIFAPEAIERVYRFSRGIPRLINLLCEHGLVNSYTDGQKLVTAETIEEVGRNLEFNLTGSGVPFFPRLRSDDGARPGSAVSRLASAPRVHAGPSPAVSEPPTLPSSAPLVEEQPGQGLAKDANEDHLSAAQMASLQTEKPDPDVASPSPTILFAPANREAVPTSEVLPADQAHSPGLNDNSNVEGVHAVPFTKPPETEISARAPSQPESPGAMRPASYSIKKRPLGNASGTRRRLIALSSVLAALIGFWWIMRMASEVDSQPTASASNPASATASQPPETRPSDASTTRVAAGSPPSNEMSPREKAASSPAANDSGLSETPEATSPSNPPVAGPEHSRAPKTERTTVARAVRTHSVVHTPRSAARPKSSSRALSSAQEAELKDKLVVARFFMDRDDYDAALEAFQAALKINPSSRDARAGVERARQARKAQETSTHP